MNARKLTTVLAMALLVFALITVAVPVAGTPNDDIIVNGADVIRQESVARSQGLIDSTTNIGARIVAQYANTLRTINLAAVPGAFQTLLGQVPSRIIFAYANTNRQFDLASVPGAFQTVLDLVPNRIIFQYANTNRNLPLAYPAALINDATPPQISNVKANAVSNDTAAIIWTTDEFANSQVSYGVQSGQYTGTASDPLYVKQHVITLTEMIPDTTYYYQVHSADQSGNAGTGPENSFKFQAVFDTLAVQKSVAPTGEVQYGKELTYTLVISAAQSASLELYDPLTDTTFVRFVQQPTGVIPTLHSVTGTLNVASALPVTVTFVVRVDVPAVAGQTVDVINQACVYVLPDTSTCKPSNQVTNQAFAPYRVFLPVILKNR